MATINSTISGSNTGDTLIGTESDQLILGGTAADSIVRAAVSAAAPATAAGAAAAASGRPSALPEADPAAVQRVDVDDVYRGVADLANVLCEVAVTRRATA